MRCLFLDAATKVDEVTGEVIHAVNDKRVAISHVSPFARFVIESRDFELEIDSESVEDLHNPRDRWALPRQPYAND